MVDFTKTLPDPVNYAALYEALLAEFAVVQIRDTECVVYNVSPSDEAIIDGIIAAHDSEALTETQQVDSATAGLKDKMALAHQANVAPHIRTLFNATLQATQDATPQPDRYTNIMSAIESTNPSPIYTRIKVCLLAELGIDYDATPHSAAQQRQICFFVRMWSTQLAVLLSN